MRANSPLTPAELDDIARRRKAAKARAREIVMTPEEEARIIAAAESDPDALPSTDEELARMRPAHDVLPDLVAAHVRNRGGRPKSANPKRVVTIRLDADVHDALKATGAGWQTRVNSMLAKAVKTGRLTRTP